MVLHVLAAPGRSKDGTRGAITEADALARFALAIRHSLLGRHADVARTLALVSTIRAARGDRAGADSARAASLGMAP